MLNILVYDTYFNIESISSISSIDRSLRVYSYNNNYSFYDNYDILKPDIVLVNRYIFPDFISDSSINIQYYDIDYIIPNINACKSSNNSIDNTILLIDRDYVLPNKELKYKDKFIKIYSIDKIIEKTHFQYCGHTDTCEQLHRLINSSSLILTTTNAILPICHTSNIPYGIYKTKGTISVKNHNNLLYYSNKDILERYICRRV